MKKICFNEKYGIEDGVLKGKIKSVRKLVTFTLHEKTLNKDMLRKVYPENIFEEDETWKFKYRGNTYKLPKMSLPFYKKHEIVAIAQSYKNSWRINPSVTNSPYFLKGTKGWNNKSMVRADLMPHQIRITNIKAEKLHDISDQDCLAEGIIKWDSGQKDIPFYSYHNAIKCDFDTPQEAYASLFNKIDKKGVWEQNPWVWVYEFELIK